MNENFNYTIEDLGSSKSPLRFTDELKKIKTDSDLRALCAVKKGFQIEIKDMPHFNRPMLRRALTVVNTGCEAETPKNAQATRKAARTSTIIAKCKKSNFLVKAKQKYKKLSSAEHQEASDDTFPTNPFNKNNSTHLPNY